jgi:hypothetical protein
LEGGELPPSKLVSVDRDLGADREREPQGDDGIACENA